MKNFLDHTDTKHHQIHLVIEPVIENGPPIIALDLNGRSLYQGALNESLIIENPLGWFQELSLSIELRDKVYDQYKETGLLVKSLTVDDIDITQHLTELICYDNDQGIDARYNYLGFNGIWKITIPGPFNHWWHHRSGQGWLLHPTKVSLGWSPS